MKHITLENELKTRIRKRRIAEAVLAVIFLTVTIVFNILYEQSAVVEEIGFGSFKHQIITRNSNFMLGIIIGCFGLIPSILFLMGDIVSSKYVTFEISGDYVTFYRGVFGMDLYINGEYKDGLLLFGYHLEATLSDGTKVNVAIGKWSAHMTFSNGHPPIDL